MTETKFTAGSSPLKRAAAKKAWEAWSAMRAGLPKRKRIRAKSAYSPGRNPSSWGNAPKGRDWQVIVRTSAGWMLPEQERRAVVTRRQLEFLRCAAKFDQLDRHAYRNIADRMGVQYRSAYEMRCQLSAKFDGATSAQIIELGRQLNRNRVSASFGRAEPGGGNR